MKKSIHVGAGDPPDALSRAFARSVRHNTVAEIGVQIVRASGLIFLARILEPADFGHFRILVAVGILAMVMCQSGLPDALIQRQDLRPEHEATGFWLMLFLAVATTAGLYLLAPMIATWMEMPPLRADIAIICLPLVIEGISAVPGARLRRRLNFRAIALSEVVAEAAFVIVAMFVVLVAKAPRLSLPMGLAARLSVHGAWIWLADGYLPTMGPSLTAGGELARFVTKVWAGAAVEVISENVDYVLVGRFLGSTLLGYYTMAWDLLRFIPDRLHRMAGRVTLPEFCRLQYSNERLATAYRDFVSYIAKIVLPIVACVAVAAPQLLDSIYGPKWSPTSTPLRLLAPGLTLVGLRMGIGSIYYAKNRPELDIYLHSGRLALIILTILLLVGSGIAGVSAGMSAVEGVVGIVGTYLACNLIDLRLRHLAAAVGSAVTVTLFCVLATTLGKFVVNEAGLHGILALTLLIVPAALTFWMLEAPVLTDFMSGGSRADIVTTP